MTLSLRALVLVAAVSLGAIVTTTVFFLVTEESSSSSDSDDTFEPSGLGDDSGLARLYEACDDGDFEACDDLYYESPVDSFFETFGSTCGRRTSETFGSCS